MVQPLYGASMLTNGTAPVTWCLATRAYVICRLNSPATSSTGGKRLSGRKRFIVVDTQGRLLGALVVGADWSEQQGARELLAQLRPRWPRLRKLWADQGYRGLAEWLQREYSVELEIVTRAPEQRGFVVLPRRWVVERSLAGFSRCRRLAKEYEHLAASSMAMIYLAACHLLLKRLAPAPNADPPYHCSR